MKQDARISGRLCTGTMPLLCSSLLLAVSCIGGCVPVEIGGVLVIQVTVLVTMMRARNKHEVAFKVVFFGFCCLTRLCISEDSVYLDVERCRSRVAVSGCNVN